MKKLYHDKHFMQGATENIVYAIIGPFSSDQSRTSETCKLDKDRVKYAKINYGVMPHNPTPVSSDEKATDVCNTEEQGMELGANLGINVVN